MADQLVSPITSTTLWDSPEQAASLLSARKPLTSHPQPKLVGYLWVGFTRHLLAQGHSRLHPASTFAAQRKHLNYRMLFSWKTLLLPDLHWCISLALTFLYPSESQTSTWTGLLVFLQQLGPTWLLVIPRHNIYSLILC